MAINPPPRRTASSLSTFEERALRRVLDRPATPQTQAQTDANFRASLARRAAQDAARASGNSKRYGENVARQVATASPDTLRTWAAGRDPVYAAAARAQLGPQTAAAPRAASPTAARQSDS